MYHPCTDVLKLEGSRKVSRFGLFQPYQNLFVHQARSHHNPIQYDHWVHIAKEYRVPEYKTILYAYSNNTFFLPRLEFRYHQVLSLPMHTRYLCMSTFDMDMTLSLSVQWQINIVLVF